MLDNNTVQFLVLLGIIILVKKFGFTAIGFRKIIKGYLEVTEDQKRKIRITVNRKIFGIFEKKKTYELKYIKIKHNLREVKEYFDIVLKDKEYILREISSNSLFDFRKKITIYLKNPSPAFKRVPIRFLPETEIKSLLQEMLELDIVELEENDFKTFSEKIAYASLLRKLGKSKEGKWKEMDL